MKIFIAALSLLLLAATAAAQQLIYVQPQSQVAPNPAAVLVPLPSVDGLVIVPSMPQQPQTGTVTDTQGNRFHYQETAPGAGSFWVYPMQSND